MKRKDTLDYANNFTIHMGQILSTYKKELLQGSIYEMNRSYMKRFEKYT